MKMQLFETDEGTMRARFQDLLGTQFSIDEATHNGRPIIRLDDDKTSSMSLDRELARMLVKMLKRFIKTGELRP